MKRKPWLVSIMMCSAFLFIAFVHLRTFAVPPGKISRTAQITTVYRAIGALARDANIRCSDDYAEKFIPRNHWKQLFPRVDFSRGYEHAIQRIKSGRRSRYYYVHARTRHIDAVLSNSLKKGIEQVVNLGAGYDSRAYRFHRLSPGVRYFEVDLPEMVADKKTKVQRIFGRLPDWVVYVPVDFNRQVLAEELVRAGYNEGKKTLFIWEGVTMYIPGEAVMDTLRFIAGRSAPGSLVVFDYRLKSSIDIRKKLAEHSKSGVFTDEPLIFGIEYGKIEEFVKHAGLELSDDIGPLEMMNNYLMDSDCRVAGYIRSSSRIACAAVPGRKR